VSFSKIVGGLGHAISYYPKVAKQLGDPCSAIALQQFLYWSFDDDKATKDGWIDVIGKDCVDQLGMSAKTMTRVKKSLESMGLIETRVSGMPARCQVRVMAEAIDSWWVDVGGTLNGFAQRGKQVSPNGATGFCPKGETIPLIKELNNIHTFDEIIGGGARWVDPQTTRTIALRRPVSDSKGVGDGVGENPRQGEDDCEQEKSLGSIYERRNLTERLLQGDTRDEI